MEVKLGKHVYFSVSMTTMNKKFPWALFLITTSSLVKHANHAMHGSETWYAYVFQCFHDNHEQMKSTKVQNPRPILHILRSMPMRVHRACAGFGQKLYACAQFIIDGLGHARWSLKMPVSRSGTAPF